MKVDSFSEMSQDMKFPFYISVQVLTGGAKTFISECSDNRETWKICCFSTKKWKGKQGDSPFFLEIFSFRRKNRIIHGKISRRKYIRFYKS
jgi:hypothetical protein